VSVKVIFHGQSNIEIHNGSHVIQVDPFYDHNPVCDKKASQVNPQTILVTHAHSDHSGDVESIAARTGATISSNFEICNHFQKKKLKVDPMNHGGSLAFPFGSAYMSIAFHTSSFDDGSYGGQPGGFVIQTGNKTIYHAGDTALFGDMELIGRLFQIDLACLPIGDRFTMGPAHAMLAAKMLRAKSVLPIHYNTWPLIAQDGDAFARDLQKAHAIKGHPLKAGESVDL
jgi:L-ascorbate metabolism protein UlaG (beta-lactamase superfamily)